MQKQLAIKIAIIFVIGLAILIPINMVTSKVHERQSYQTQAKDSVAQSWTGPQMIITPMIIIPYRLVIPRAPINKGRKLVNEAETAIVDRLTIVIPQKITGNIEVDNKSVFKGIYEIPVYNSQITLSGQFTTNTLRDEIAKIKATSGFESIGQPYISMHIADVRGIDKAPTLTINNQSITLHPDSRLPSLSNGLSGSLPTQANSAELAFSLSLSLRGMASLSFIPLASDAILKMHSQWPHPEFIGASLPAQRQISANGFDASWSSTRYSSNSLSLLQQCISANNCRKLKRSSSGVSFIEPVDVYLQSERAIKYAILFIGLSFISFFIFEHLKHIRIHPIQYTFVGLATAVFYLLLISLAEHIAFHWAYLIAVSCCSTLLLFYLRYMLKQLSAACLFSAMIVLLYSLLYIIVQAEDFALLMGAFLVFGVLATLMFVTRKIDWYELSTPHDKQTENPKPTVS